jgi:hypothetical protein
MLLELPPFLRQDVGVRHNVKVLSTKLLLHLNHVKAQSVLSSHLVRRREVIDSLELVQSLV